MSITTKFIPHSLIGIVSVLPAMLVMPAMAANVSNYTDFVTSAKADVEEGQTRTTSLDSDITVLSMLAPKDGVINGNGHTLKNLSFSGTPELVGQFGAYAWQYTNDSGATVKLYTEKSSLSTSSGGTEVFSDPELQNSIGRIDYKSGNYFDITGRGIITNYTVVTDGEGFVNGVYQVESTSAKTYHIVCLEDESGNRVYVRKNLTKKDGGYTAAEVMDDSASATYYEDYFGENQHTISIKGVAATDDGYALTAPEKMLLDNNGLAVQKPNKEYIVNGQYFYTSPTANIDTVGTVYYTPDLYNTGMSVDRTGDSPLFYMKNNSLFVGSNGKDVTINDVIMSDFVYASTSNQGAALTLSWGGSATVNNSVFKNNINKDSELGGAASIIGGNLTLNNVSFQNNTGLGGGSALMVGNKIEKKNNVYYYHIGNAEIHGGDFTNNNSSDVGAIYVTLKDTENATAKGIEALDNELLLDGTLFRGNHSVLAAGAIGNFGSMTIQNGTTFLGNYTEGDGGVMFLGAESTTSITDSVFGAVGSGNTAGGKGGVIRTRDATEANNAYAKLDILAGSQFIGNGAADGGVLYNNFYSSATNADAVTIADSTFTSNSASNNGGVIFNSGDLDNGGNGSAGKIRISGSTFTDNSAAVNGGAIYNVGTMILSGTNTFSGNTANGVANDIYNVATLDVAGGTTNISGGIAGTGALTIADGATLNLGTASIVQNTITLDGIVNADLKSANEFAFLDAATFTDTTTGELNLTLKSVGEYNVFKNAVFANTNIADSSVFDYSWNDAGDTITVSTKSASEIIEAIDDVKAESVNAVVAMANAKDETAQQIGNALAAALADGDSELVEHEVKKLAPEEKPVTHSVASSVQNQVLTLTANRMTGGMAAGRAGGDEINADYGFWAQGLYNKSRFLGEFDGQSRGVAVGFDALINKMYTLGIGYAFSNSDIDMSGDGGSFDIDSHTVFVYGQYKPSQWFINATLSNTVSKYTEKAVVMGTPTETEYDVNSFGIQAMTGYDFKSGITPMVGARYLHVTTDGHERLLGYVDDSKSSFLSAVAGLKYAFDIQDTGSVRWTPELRALATYDVIADKNGATVYVPGGSIYHVAGDRMSRGGGELGMGLTAEWRGLELSLNYDLQLREDYLSHTGMVKLRCEF